MSATWTAIGQIAIVVVVLAAAHRPLGDHIFHTLTSPKHLAVERAGYRLMRVDPDAEQRWSTYLLSVLGFSLASVLLLFGLGRLQDTLPLDIGMAPLDPAGAWNTAVSFVTNTNWQWYSGEAAAGHLFQMAGLAVQNFLSAAVGIAVVAALARGFARSGTDSRVGNFWADLVRCTLYVLLPVSLIAALFMVQQGVIQNFKPYLEVTTLEGLSAGGRLHPLQQAWIDEQVPQCGFCQNGQIMTAKALLDRNPHPTDAQIREGMARTLCRCMTYYRVQAAIKRVAGGRV